MQFTLILSELINPLLEKWEGTSEKDLNHANIVNNLVTHISNKLII